MNIQSLQATDAELGSDWAMYLGDCAEVVKQLPDRSVDFSVYSPPFANLYTYSDSERDMGNCEDDAEFMRHYEFMVRELYRVLRPGRLVAVHCKDLVNYKGRDGMAGLRDFPGEIIRCHLAAGFSYHSRVTIWKCPVTEMQRTKAHGLLWKQVRKDSTFSRQGLAEYVLVFRKWADAEGTDVVPVKHTMAEFPLDRWQQWASPVWDDSAGLDVEHGIVRRVRAALNLLREQLQVGQVWKDINQTDVLNTARAREDRDSKHMCPLQLDLIERCVGLWSNPGDIVLSPFAGVGSEGVVSLQQGRKFVGIELKRSYFNDAVANLKAALKQQDLFGEAV